MAGSYPDVPGRRMGWDGDGTVSASIQTDSSWTGPEAAVRENSPAEAAELNDEDIGAVTQAYDSLYGWSFLIFPELREIDGISVGGSSAGNGFKAVETSADSTDGISGTWTTAIADVHSTDNPFTLIDYRDYIDSMAATSRRALRVQRGLVSGQTGAQLRWLHVYGTISPGSTPDKMIWIDEATGVEFTTAIDFGDIPRGGSEDVELRLRNDSASLTANNIQYTAESLYESSGGWYTFTLPGGATFQSARQIASLAAATTSGLIVMRRITPGDEDLSLHAGRALVDVDSFT